MNYNLNNLNPTDFEHLVQALSRNILGNGTISFGSGPDGGREAVLNGPAPYPTSSNQWDGYWVIQAKFKEVLVADDTKDFNWLKDNITKELEKYSSRTTKVRNPDNYLLFTNIILTPAAGSGGRDKATKLEIDLSKKFKIRNIRIISYDDMRDFLNTNRDVATSFSAFISSGDVLNSLLTLLSTGDVRKKRITEIVASFLDKEFDEDTVSKLDHAGKLTSDKVHLEKVFIDLSITGGGERNEDNGKFIRKILSLGNNILKYNTELSSHFVLIAGPGSGKSTLTQFLAQIYRAFFLLDIDSCQNKHEYLETFTNGYKSNIGLSPKWVRLPIRIILKEYAGWMNRIKNTNMGTSTAMLDFIVQSVNQKGHGDLKPHEIVDVLRAIPLIFIFDGLDEVPQSSNRKDVLSELNIFTNIDLRRMDADFIIIATSRPQGYSQEFDEKKYRHLRIEDLSELECEEYLERLLENLIGNSVDRSEKFDILMQALKEPEISRLMRTPLQASIMAILVKSGGQPPRNKFALFSNYYDVIFNRERQRNISRIISEKQNYVDDIHRRLGYYLQVVSEEKNNPSATISTEKYRLIIVQYLSSCGLETEEVSQIAEELLKASLDRLVFISELEDGKVGFSIRSLQEFFAALEFTKKAKDEQLKANFSKICKCAYWNNTLLFAIAYLFKERPHAVPYVESICNELNGSSDDPQSKTLMSIVRLGSWLALDIVNEGIFRDYRNHENKFCGLLKHLFEIAPCPKHREIAKLSPHVKEKWIYNLIEAALIDPTNETTWTVCIYLLLAGDNRVGEIIHRRWPTNLDHQRRIVYIFVENECISPFLVEKCNSILPTCAKNELWEIFANHLDSVDGLLGTDLLSIESKNIIFEVLFFLELCGPYQDSAGVLLSNHFGFSPKFIESRRSVRYVEIVDGYEIGFRPFSAPIDSLVEIQNWANENKMELVEAYCCYLKNSTNEMRHRLLKIINKEISEYVELIKNHPIGWYVADVVLFDNQKKDIEHFVNLYTRFWQGLSIDKTTKIENTYNIINLFGLFHFSIRIDELLGKMSQFIDRYQAQESEIAGELCFLFLKLAEIVVQHIEYNEQDLLIRNENINSFYTKCFVQTMSLEAVQFFYDMQSVVYFLSPEILDTYIEKIEGRTREIYRPALMKSLTCIERVATLIKYQMARRTSCSYETFYNFIQYIRDIKAVLPQLPYTDIIKYQKIDTSEKWKLLILLTDVNFSFEHQTAISEIVERRPDLFGEKEFVDALVANLKAGTEYGANNQYFDEVLLLFNEKLTDCTTKQRSVFEDCLRQYVLNKSSNLISEIGKYTG